MEENNLPNQITEEELEKEAKEQEEKMEEKKMTIGKAIPANRVGLLMIVGILLLVAVLIWYVFSLYQMQLGQQQRKFMQNQEVMTGENEEMTMEKPDSEKTEEELINDLSNDVEDDIDAIDNEMQNMINELDNIEQQPVSE